MARGRPKTARQRAASRRNIVKAQKASARARLAAPNKRVIPTAAVAARRRNQRVKTAKKVGAAVAVGVVVGSVGYKVNYNRKYVTGYHRTSEAAAKEIVKTRSFKSLTNQRGVEGTDKLIWLDKSGSLAFAKNADFGPATIKIRKIPKSAVTTHRDSMAKQMASFGLPNDAGGSVPTWFAVENQVLGNLKMKKLKRPISTMLRLSTTTERRRIARARRIDQMFETSGQHQMRYLADNWDPLNKNRRDKAKIAQLQKDLLKMISVEKNKARQRAYVSSKYGL